MQSSNPGNAGGLRMHGTNVYIAVDGFRNPKANQLLDVQNPVNNGIFTISTGDRRISEPSTVLVDMDELSTNPTF